jgi:hypothetical protein
MPGYASGHARRNLFRPGALAGLGLAALLGSWLAGCAGMQSRGDESERDEKAAPSEAAAPAVTPSTTRHFEEPGEIDKLLDAKPIALAAVKPASQAQAAAKAAAPEPAKGKGNFRIQVGAESDVDAAQAKKAEYEKLLGGTVDVVFDAPYYKLRWGYFDSKQDAEDKILEISDLKIQGFVVKQ